MSYEVEVNGKNVSVCCSENNRGHTPMTMYMSFDKLTKSEEREARDKAIVLFRADGLS